MEECGWGYNKKGGAGGAQNGEGVGLMLLWSMLLMAFWFRCFQVIRTEFVYWQTKRPEHFSKENFPVFIVCDESEDHCYGTPIHEYPGLVKVCAREKKCGKNIFDNLLTFRVDIFMSESFPSPLSSAYELELHWNTKLYQAVCRARTRTRVEFTTVLGCLSTLVRTDLVYSRTSDKGPSEKGTTSLQWTLLRTPFQ